MARIENPSVKKQANFRKYYMVSKVNFLAAIIVLAVCITVRKLSAETEVAGKYVNIVPHNGNLYLDIGTFQAFLYSSMFSIIVQIAVARQQYF